MPTLLGASHRPRLSAANWLGIATAVTRGSQAALLLLAATMMSPAEYGQFALASAIILLISMIAEGGITQATTTTTAITTREEQSLAARALAVGLLGALLATAIGYAFSFRDGFHDTVKFAAVLSCVIPVTACAAVSAGRLQRMQEFSRIARYQMQGAAVGVALALCLIILGRPVLGLVILTTASSIFFGARILFANATRIRPRMARVNSNLNSLSNYALLSNVFGMAGRRSGEFSAGLLAGPAAVGQFSVAYRVLMTGTEVFLHSRERVFLAKQSELLETQGRAHAWRYSNRSQLSCFLVVGPIFVLAGVVCLFLMPVVFGQDWAEVGTISFILCIAGAAQSSFNLLYSSFYILVGARSALVYQIIQVAFLTAALVVGMWNSLLTGAVTYAVASSIFAVLTVFYRAQRRGHSTVRGDKWRAYS